MIVEVEVTANDIKQGQDDVRLKKPKCSEYCAIARAVARTLRDEHVAWGFAEGFIFEESTRRAKYELNGATRADRIACTSFVYAHDALQYVKPFKFQMEVGNAVKIR